ncbi:hypothetical protein BJX64DRAFT_289835 [Aspergillus heterothallicus]
MDNGTAVFAKLLLPSMPQAAGTCSEVATLDLLRNELGLPVPKVLAWSDNSEEPVGAGYIIKEQPQGTGLHALWPNMSLEEKSEITLELATIQAHIARVEFDSFWSIYYRQDCDSTLPPLKISNRFRVGPSVQPSDWKKERKTMNQFQGPCVHKFRSYMTLSPESSCPLDPSKMDLLAHRVHFKELNLKFHQYKDLMVIGLDGSVPTEKFEQQAEALWERMEKIIEGAAYKQQRRREIRRMELTDPHSPERGIVRDF